jgi:hypothetical protein
VATRSTIRERARIRADQDGSTFPTDAQYNLLIDEAVKDVWYDLVRAGWPIGYQSVAVPLADVNPVTLSGVGVTGPVAFIQGVYWLNGGEYVELRRLPEGDRAGVMSLSGANTPSYYEVRVDPSGNGLTVAFYPHVPGSYVVHYVPEHQGLVNDSSEWLGPARSDELIVLRAASKGMRKEGNDQGAAQLDKEYTVMLQKVQELASWLDMRNPPTIRDVQSSRMKRDLSDWDVDPFF